VGRKSSRVDVKRTVRNALPEHYVMVIVGPDGRIMNLAITGLSQEGVVATVKGAWRIIRRMRRKQFMRRIFGWLSFARAK
jgi:hypothetical protein